MPSSTGPTGSPGVEHTAVELTVSVGLAGIIGKVCQGHSSPKDDMRFLCITMASLSQALRLGDLPPPHRTFQGHATHIIEWSMMLRPNDSWSTCIPQGIATFLHYASRRSAGTRDTTENVSTTETLTGLWRAR